MDDFLLISKTIEFLEEDKSGYIYQLIDLYSLMHSLLLEDEYHEISKQLNENKCWACQESFIKLKMLCSSIGNIQCFELSC